MDISMNDNKRAILEAVATAEKQLHPFEYPTAGVSYEDIVDTFGSLDFPVVPEMYIPARLRGLSDLSPPALDQVGSSGSSASADYRLTDHGWDIVEEDPP